MMAWMNAESLRRTLALRETVFWSRSRREFWHKGATSGNTQRVVDVRIDCDGDTLLLLVEPAGPACHTGATSCFYRSLTETRDAEDFHGSIASGNGEVKIGARGELRGADLTPTSVIAARGMENHHKMSTIETLYATILSRRDNPTPGSYTAQLSPRAKTKCSRKWARRPWR